MFFGGRRSKIFSLSCCRHGNTEDDVNSVFKREPVITIQFGSEVVFNHERARAHAHRHTHTEPSNRMGDLEAVRTTSWFVWFMRCFRSDCAGFATEQMPH